MAFQDCIDEIQKAAGRNLSDEELIDMQERLQNEIKRRKAQNVVASSDEITMQAAKDLAAEIKRAAYVQRRGAALSFIARHKSFDFIKTNYKDDIVEGMAARTIGSSTVRVGSMDSVANSQQELMARFLGGFVTDLDIAGLLKIFNSGVLDEDIFNAKWSLTAENAPAYNGPKEAMEIAKILEKYQEVSRKLANDYGADIRKYPGFITKRTHDALKIEKAKFETWKQDVLNGLDMSRTFPDGKNPDEILQNIFNNITSGVYLKASDEVTGFKGGTMNIAKKMSEDRVLHFKDGKAEYDYFKKYGYSSLGDAVFKEFQIRAQNIGLMQQFGPNFQDTINRVSDMLLKDKDISPKQKQALSRALAPGGRLDNYIKEVDGSTRIPANQMWAQVGSGMRLAQGMAKLGGALFSQIGDIPVVASEISYQQGGGLFSGMVTQLEEMTRGMKSNDKKLLYKNLSVALDGMLAHGSRVFDAQDNLPGNMAKLQQLFFKLNLQQPWNDAFRSGVARVMSHYLANISGNTFDKLPKEINRALSLYGIDAGKWDIIRNLPETLADGRKYLTAEGIDKVPDNVIGDYLKAQGKKDTSYNIRMMREEINRQLRTFFNSRVSIGQLEAGAQTRAFWTQGTRPGTVMAETLKFVGQFKSHPTSFVHKVLAREVYGRGSDSIKDAMRNGNGELIGLARLIVSTTIFGYMSMQLKELIKGREPRVPESPGDYLKIIQASMLQGGGLGIYGDFLFGEMRNRYGQSPISSLLGPTLGAGNDVLDLWGRFKQGDPMAAQGLRLVLNNTPFYNLFYVKPVMDYMIIYQLQEAINPGYLRRMEQRIQKENNSSFLFPPSQYAQ